MVSGKDRAKWTDDIVTDLVDIVVSNEEITQALLINVTNRPTDPIYSKIKKLLQERYTSNTCNNP